MDEAVNEEIKKDENSSEIEYPSEFEQSNRQKSKDPKLEPVNSDFINYILSIFSFSWMKILNVIKFQAENKVGKMKILT